MRISVFGLGYVGCVSAACLAQRGHQVLGLDINPQKVEIIKAGRAPVIEPDLDRLIKDSIEKDRFRVSLESRGALHKSDVSLICVGTPSQKNGNLDLKNVESVCRSIGMELSQQQNYHVVVVRSTVLPGSTEKRLIPLLEKHSGRKAGWDFGVCFNPEFLREGSAVSDFYDPGQIIIGEFDERSGEIVETLYQGIPASIVHTTIPTAEIVKYANNAFHALKVTFANEIGVLCKAHGIDGRVVMESLCQDKRLNISPAYLKPGFAFGGSCLPKDLRALLYRAKERDLMCSLLKGIWTSNQQQIQRGIDLVESAGHKRIGILGLSFKPGTDDLRESPIVSLTEALIGKGYQLAIYDESVEFARLMGTNKDFLEQEIPHITSLISSSLEELMEWAEVVVVAHGGETARWALSLMQTDQVLIDLVGVVQNNDDVRGGYEGICW